MSSHPTDEVTEIPPFPDPWIWFSIASYEYNIDFSMARWNIFNLLANFNVKFKVSVPYVKTSKTYW